MARATEHAERVRRLYHARRLVEQRVSDMKRTLTSLALWQRRVKYYEKEVAKSDDERARERITREQRRQQRVWPRARKIVT